MKMKMAARGFAALATVCLFTAAAWAAPQEENLGAGRSELNGDSVEYSVKTGLMTATGNVVLRYEDGVATADFASYNTKDSTGTLTGGVVADKGDMHIVCDRVNILSNTQISAVGNVHARQKDKSVDAPQIDYDSGEQYVRLPSGGTLGAAEGTFTADYMEGWMRDNRCRAVGNAHVISPPKDFEGGGDEAEYFGKESGKLVLTGNAWAVQGNHTLKSGRLTVYLDERGEAEAVPDEKEEK
ncbi:MAG: organic solvent tolerance protein OstA [Schwartzia sp.]|nr:organic solvent tolerance protein OstA [Schwartzia sp. (in: firmicutes)]